MKTLKIFSIAFLSSIALGFAQDVNQAKKAIDAEQYDKAKSILKSIIKANPIDGRANFLLGNLYLTESVADSAKISFQKGLGSSVMNRLNYIGLGTLDLDGGNAVAAETNFALALKDAKKKDIEELVAIGRSYVFSSKPNYKKAIEYLNRAKLINPNDALVQLALGDAFYGDKNQNEAYAAYRNAFQFDPTLLRAKMQLGVLLKGAKSYEEAINSFNEVIALSADYGPVYRELAETYYKWGRNKRSKEAEHMQTAIGHYEKYMSLTDYSLDSRMRHADFLVLVKDYKALEVEANKMIEMDKVNPRIFRYLGYSAFENGNVDLAIKSLESFIASPVNKVISKDYLYLGNAKFKKGLSADGLSMNSILFESGLADIRKALEMEPLSVKDLNEIGVKIYNMKLYKEAIPIFEIGASIPENENFVEDNKYYGLAIYSSNNRNGVIPDPIMLNKADVAFGNVLTASPNTIDIYLFRARTNNLINNYELVIKYYETYIAKVTEKGQEELAKPATTKKVIESYNNIAASYANTDNNLKAIEYFNKTLAIDPANPYASASIVKLKK